MNLFDIFNNSNPSGSVKQEDSGGVRTYDVSDPS